MSTPRLIVVSYVSEGDCPAAALACPSDWEAVWTLFGFNCKSDAAAPDVELAAAPVVATADAAALVAAVTELAAATLLAAAAVVVVPCPTCPPRPPRAPPFLCAKVTSSRPAERARAKTTLL
jgi:hypothetical protein